jgi:drug/metabolite transporter (DMT)-like permease
VGSPDRRRAFANAIPFTLFAIAEREVSSGVAGVINATTPLWTLLLALGTGHDRTMSKVQVGGFILGLFGTVLIFQPWRSETGIASWAGLACLTAAASYGVSYVYMDRYLARRGIASLALSASQLIAATGILALAVPFAGLHPSRYALTSSPPYRSSGHSAPDSHTSSTTGSSLTKATPHPS